MQSNEKYGREQIVVSPEGPESDTRAIRVAMDALAERGGGTLRLRPGRYVLTDSVYLRPDVALIGEDGVVLARTEFVASDLAVDADVGQFEFTPVDASVFRPGMGVRFYDDVFGWAVQPVQLAVTAIQGGRVLLNEMNINDRLAENHARVVNYFPIIYGHLADRAMVDGITIDASVRDSGELDGMRCAAVYLYRSTDCTLRRLKISGARGDAICFGKASLRTLVEDCEVFDNMCHGIHPGSHSAHCTIRRCHIHHNGADGLYVCWGIRHSVFEENDIHHNGHLLWRSGFSIGHKDSDNLIVRNHIYANCKYGICVRRKTEANGAHRNTFRENVIENNGWNPSEIPEDLREIVASEPAGCGVLVMGITHDLTFERNVIRDTRPQGQQFQRNAMHFALGVSRVRLLDNEIADHPDGNVVDEAGAVDDN